MALAGASTRHGTPTGERPPRVPDPPTVAGLPLAEAVALLERHLSRGPQRRPELVALGTAIGAAAAATGRWPSIALWAVLRNGATCIGALPWLRAAKLQTLTARLELELPLPHKVDPIVAVTLLQAVAAGGLEAACGPWLVLSSVDANGTAVTLTLYPIPVHRWLRADPVGRVLAKMGEDFRRRSQTLATQTLEAEVSRAQLRVQVEERTAQLREVIETKEAQRRQLAERLAQLEVARIALEAHNARLDRLQESLVRSTQLTAVGEVAAEVAHEGLNALTPASAITAQLCGEVDELLHEHLELLGTIVAAWEGALGRGDVAALSTACLQPVTTLDGGTHTVLEDDLESLRAIRHDLGQLHLQLEDGLAVARRNLERVETMVRQLQQTPLRTLQVPRTQLLQPLLDEVSAAVAGTLRTTGVRLQQEAPQGEVPIHLDGIELVRVLHNLINNAIDVLRSVPQRPDPTVRLVVHDDSDAVRLLVCDNGPGIAPEHQGRLFQIGFTTKPADEGTGLGLSIAQQLARGWGGDLRLQQSGPHGTCFEVVLPRPPRGEA